MRDPIEARKVETKQIADFVDGPVWAWLRPFLDDQLRGLVLLTAQHGISPEDRALIAGRAGLIAEILARPERLLSVVVDTAAAIEPYRRMPAPKGTGTLA